MGSNMRQECGADEMEPPAPAEIQIPNPQAVSNQHAANMFSDQIGSDDGDGGSEVERGDGGMKANRPTKSKLAANITL